MLFLVTMDKTTVFSKDLITFTIFFVSLFVSVFPEPIIVERPLLFFLLIILSLTFKRTLGETVGDLAISVVFFITFSNAPIASFCAPGKNGNSSYPINRPNCIMLESLVF